MRALVRECGLEDRVEITGHVGLEEFESRIAETDVALNLRERTVGETSGSLCRIMAAGVCAVVYAVGWFGELPDDCVVKVEPGAHADGLLRAYLARLIEDAELRARLGANARRHVVAEHDIRRSAEGYLDFIREVAAARPRRRLLAALSTELSALGVEPDLDDALVRGVAAEFAALAPEGLFAPVPPAPKGSWVQPDTPFPEAPAYTGRAVVSDNGSHASNGNGRGRKLEGVDYKRAAVEYPRRITPERLHHLRTKPFYNLANKPERYAGDGIDADTFRHFCDFANVAQALALPPDRRILDVGCGSGWLSEYFARLGYDVTGIDISPDLIEVARERVERVPYGADHETPLRCRFLVHDVEGAPLEEQFDAVVCYDSLHHFEDERAVIRNLAAMTKYGGSLFILEGDRPEEGSENEEELLEVMRNFGTLESPFSRDYLRALLDALRLRRRRRLRQRQRPLRARLARRRAPARRAAARQLPPLQEGHGRGGAAGRLRPRHARPFGARRAHEFSRRLAARRSRPARRRRRDSSSRTRATRSGSRGWPSARARACSASASTTRPARSSRSATARRRCRARSRPASRPRSSSS